MARKPHVFQSRDELLAALASKKNAIAVAKLLMPREAPIKALVTQSVSGNTFRAFAIRKFGVRPSEVYRNWASHTLKDDLPRFAAFDTEMELRNYLFERAERLQARWLEATGGKHSLGFGRATKLLNLSFKVVSGSSMLPQTQRTALLRMLDVPLDSFTLRGIRLLAPQLRITRHASMRFVTTREQYVEIQTVIRELCSPDFFPIHYETAAWDLAHDTSEKTS
ncbi:hypothetical protein [Hyphomicrobium sp. CS1GBMeth3]|uniref:hypothetical protein n=1 Tax=Hyphomicrobium sp. CS1GBMeth3 TaxID=1892845 RepID=UPI001114C660|nr:hypothetical protein [Hyphomicrobium sp. CS1GBMeth3]